MWTKPQGHNWMRDPQFCHHKQPEKDTADAKQPENVCGIPAILLPLRQRQEQRDPVSIIDTETPGALEPLNRGGRVALDMSDDVLGKTLRKASLGREPVVVPFRGLVFGRNRYKSAARELGAPNATSVFSLLDREPSEEELRKVVVAFTRHGFRI